MLNKMFKHFNTHAYCYGKCINRNENDEHEIIKPQEEIKEKI